MIDASKQLAQRAVDAAFTKNALEPRLLDVHELCSYTDFILILSAKNTRQVEAIAEAVEVGLKMHGYDPLGREGQRAGQWLLLDFGDLVVHVFHHEVREYYDIEGLWSDAQVVELDVPPELRYANMYA